MFTNIPAYANYFNTLSLSTQMLVYQKGQGGSGIVCYDRQCNEVYFAQHSDAALIQTQIQGFRFITPTERAVQMYIFLCSSLTYTETSHKVRLIPFCAMYQ